MDWRI